MTRQYVACEFAEGGRRYAYHNDGEPFSVGDRVVVDSKNGEATVTVVETHSERHRSRPSRSRAAPSQSPRSPERTFRAAVDDTEQDWANDEDRWMSERDWPDDYLGGHTEKSIIAEVDGVRCVVTVSAPEDHQVDAVVTALIKGAG